MKIMLTRQVDAAIERTKRFWLYNTCQEMRLAHCRLSIADLFRSQKLKYVPKTFNLRFGIPNLKLKERIATHKSGLAQL